MPGSARRPPDRGLRGAANPVRVRRAARKAGRPAAPTRPPARPTVAGGCASASRARRRRAAPAACSIADRSAPSSEPSRLSPSWSYACGSQCSASALARSMRLRLPCSTRISPMRPPDCALHVEGALELGAGDEPELDEDLADRPPGIVRSGALVGHRLELPRVAVAAVHPRGIGTEAVEVQRNRCRPRLSRRRAGRPRSRRRRRRPARGRGAGASSGCGRRASSPSSR